MIPFNKPTISETEKAYVIDALNNNRISGDGKYTFYVYERFREILGIENVLLTTSGTTALEMAAILSELSPEDEVIVPSFTFSSTANSFMLRNARPIFCDIRRDTLNIDECKVEELISSKTKAIFAVDYAGIPAEMEALKDISKKHGLFLIEDAAQAVGSYYHNKPAGTLGDFGCYSFHETKNYSMGEGGAIVINNPLYINRAEIIREKGTNRRQVLNGLTDKYTWHDIGSSFLPSDILAAVLYGQLERYDEIMKKRLSVWETYHHELKELEGDGLVTLPVVPEGVKHNGHAYNIILRSADERNHLVDKLREADIYAYICYVPLHSAPMGRRIGYSPEQCPVTEDLGYRTLRLPLYADMSEEDGMLVVDNIKNTLRGIK